MGCHIFLAYGYNKRSLMLINMPQSKSSKQTQRLLKRWLNGSQLDMRIACETLSSLSLPRALSLSWFLFNSNGHRIGSIGSVFFFSLSSVNYCYDYYYFFHFHFSSLYFIFKVIAWLLNHKIAHEHISSKFGYATV